MEGPEDVARSIYQVEPPRFGGGGGACGGQLMAASCRRLGVLVQDVTPPTVGAVDMPSLGFDVKIHARVAQRAANAVAVHLGRVHLDGFNGLGHGDPHTIR